MTRYKLLKTILKEDNKAFVCTGNIELLTVKQVVSVAQSILNTKVKGDSGIPVKMPNGDINYFTIDINIIGNSVKIHVIDNGRMFKANEL